VISSEDRPWLNLAASIDPIGTLETICALAADLKAIVPQMGKSGALTPLEFSYATRNFRDTVAVPAYMNISAPYASKRLGSSEGQPLSATAQNFEWPSGNALGQNPTIAKAEAALSVLDEITGESYQATANRFDETRAKYVEIANQLRTALNQRLGQLNDISPDLVAARRERVGQAQRIAENARLRTIANMSGTLSMLVEPIANWQFRRALNAAERAQVKSDLPF